jgi:ATP-dependent protease HslVU (ClpYQ) peptidase subunit
MELLEIQFQRATSFILGSSREMFEPSSALTGAGSGGAYRDDVRALNSRKSPTAKKISLRDESRFARAIVAVAGAVPLTVVVIPLACETADSNRIY